MELDKSDLAELASLGKHRAGPRALATVLGSVLGGLAPFLLAIVFSRRSFGEQIEFYGSTWFEGLIGLLGEFVVPVLVSGLAGAAVGYCLGCACSSDIAFGRRVVAGGVAAGFVVAILIAVVVYWSELFRSISPADTDSAEVLDDVLWLVIGPGFHGAWIGAVICGAVWATFSRRKVGPLRGAIGSAIVAGLLSTMVMLLIEQLTSPPGNYQGGAGFGPQVGHFLTFFLAHLFVVLPLTMIVGAILGWRWHRPLPRSVTDIGRLDDQPIAKAAEE
ncbi:hypothetical protein FYK55_25220 [Roseiconus nitratireducens]|uniref:Uncharacterized protein n=1 Tax=Roseiconus nitratireducens TaxID=2605748 RepID=A0A5M6CXS0_9BACT|nr:hypothetical protein [Roseiconus nitratireducens]KAA5539220.1 hypothetical protein FYK55_25220 [Roseiconus nitratireducens]